MSTLLNGNRSGGHDGPPLPIPSLSFSLSTPPGMSPEDEFIPIGASCSYSTSSPSTMKEATKAGGTSSPVQIDSARGEDEPPQNSPFLPHGSLLGAQPGMGRRPSSQVISGGDICPSDMGSSISAFLESQLLTECLVTVSTDSESGRSLVDPKAKERGMKDPHLVSVASEFISEVISKAQEEALRNNEEVTEKVGLLSFGSSRERRRGPWYARAVRFLSTAFGRICPCRTTGDP